MVTDGKKQENTSVPSLSNLPFYFNLTRNSVLHVLLAMERKKYSLCIEETFNRKNTGAGWSQLLCQTEIIQCSVKDVLQNCNCLVYVTYQMNSLSSFKFYPELVVYNHHIVSNK